jgi:uncharacterized protein YcgI (DUF1989 family)
MALGRKRFFIRYNQHAETIETRIVEGRNAPRGLYWKEITFDHCCGKNFIAGCSLDARTFKSAVVVANNFYDVTFKHGTNTLFFVDNAVSLAAAVTTLNAKYEGLAVFSVTSDNRVQVITNVCDSTYSIVAVGVVS